ncbi:MAG TPA: protein kinase [Blastocatellia bacterium]|nr:protein kinase [Blastocatellia bacterium]
MTPKRWKQIDELAQAALERGGDERAAFLDEACAGDDSLRHEVESQIVYQQQASKFLEEPAFKHAAELMGDSQPEAESMEGRIISHYSILRKLGAGGMGEVYLAQDTTLSRKVAIKFLSQNSVADEQARKRLVREARAAAALDHSHICAVYEVGEEAGYSFIVMQYVEGETLASRIECQPIEIREALEIAVQIASALAEAHSHRIIHRDVKPQNVMLTASGQVKVLDFGLARVVREGSLIDSISETESILTMPGSVIGTVPYMSPEQVRGESLDARSDIFSFGAVLYEMLSGRNPFEAESVGATMASILTKEPAPLARYASDVPDELQRIVRKALSKDKEGRYQGIKDLLIDLREVKQELEFEAKRERSIGQEVRGSPLDSVAILPFFNANVDPSSDYLADGIPESIINNLSQLPGLKVMSRNSVLRFKGQQTDAQEVGQKLGVRAVLTGSIAQRGENLAISIELVDVRDNRQIWGQQHTRKLADVFALQEEIAMDISEKLRLKLTGAEIQQLAKRPTENLKAFQYYVQGRSHAPRSTREDMLTAIRHYEKAIEEDRDYALAYAGLAEAYAVLGLRGHIAPSEGRRKTEEKARKALALDENLAEAHAALGLVYTAFVPFDFSRGDREVRRAIELSPSLALAHFYLGSSLLRQGHLDESLEEQLKARELDPFTSLNARQVAAPYFFKRDYARAIELLRQANLLGPALSTTWEIGVYIQNRLFNEALAELEKAKRERERDPILIYGTGMVYAAQGKRAKALQIIKELEAMSGASLSQAHWIAKIYATLNERDLALRWLERGLAEGAIGTFYKDEPVWDPIRSEPHFADLVRRMGVPA